MKGLVLLLSLLISVKALAWGERGHHIIGRNAALLMTDVITKEGKKKGIDQFYRSFFIALGHLSNIPDTQWKDTYHVMKKIKKTNSPNHYFDPEILIGLPGKDFKAWEKKLKALPEDYKLAEKMYDGKPTPLKDLPKKYQKIKLYKDVGSAPWRVRDLYEQLVAAFSCIKSKEKSWEKSFSKGKDYKKPRWPTAHNKSKSLSYFCNKSVHPFVDAYRVVVFSGILSHFVADLAQPMHNTVNFDGYHTGNGGLHAYFESQVVHAMSPSFSGEVYKLAADAGFRKSLLEKLDVSWDKSASSFKFIMNLSVDSYRDLQTMIDLDNKVSIVKKGGVTNWGDKSFFSNKAKYPAALRKDPADKTVTKVFKPLIKKRMAVGIVALNYLWLKAWEQGGKPKLKGIKMWEIPYPLSVDFLWPRYR